MLAYDENGNIREFQETSYISVCKQCHKLYRCSRTEQIPGFREWEENVCPYCGYENGKSMSYEYINNRLTPNEIKELKKKSLINTLIEYADKQYQKQYCDICNHPLKCPAKLCKANCKECLEEIHFPDRHSNGKKAYDCDKLIDFYVCDYSFKYASEMLYLIRTSDTLRKIDNYNVVSIGCGGCADLMALETFCHENSFDKSVSYLGIDNNRRWIPLHKVIKTYKTSTIQNVEYWYKDATYFKKTIPKANVIVLQYIVSTLYQKSGSNDALNNLFDNLIDNIIKPALKPCVILINDVNSINRGRDYCDSLVAKLRGKGISGREKKYYFETLNTNGYQRVGYKHSSNDILYHDVLNAIPNRQVFLDTYQPWQFCTSFQMILEIR